MTTTIPVAKPVSQIKLAPGSAISISHVSWQEFETILEELGEKRSARIAYSNEILEIVVPLPEHEKPKEIISDIVKTLLKATDRKYEPFGSTTFKREGTAGVEPDACFYIANYQRMINRRRLQPNDPPPDLAIETDVTSKTTLEAYRAIAVPELWIYDSGKLTIYLLKEGAPNLAETEFQPTTGAQYQESDTSPTFPEISLTQMIPEAVERSWQVGTVQALEEFEAAIADRV